MTDNISKENKTLIKVTFNPVVRSYIFVYVSFILFVSIIGIPLLVIWCCGLGQWYSRLFFEKLECDLKETALRFKMGIMFTKEKTIPLENIQDMTFIEGPLLRKFNLSIFKVETAGRGDDNDSHMKLIGIVNAHLFRDEVFKQRRILKDKEHTNDETVVLVEIKNTLERIEKLIKK